MKEDSISKSIHVSESAEFIADEYYHLKKKESSTG